MLKSMENQGRKLSLTDIQELETFLNIKLPESYVTFLLEYNGGRPTPRFYPIEGTEGVYIGDSGGIHFFYWIDGPEDEEPHIKECYDIRENYQIFKGRIPYNLLPIADDEGDNQVCLSLYGQDAGWIWYWDHEQEMEVPDYSNCYKIAESFQEFIDGLFDYDFENDCRIYNS
jgi:hypothetical protein